MGLLNPTLVGRACELSALDDALNSAFDANGQTIFISGEAGSGKTRVINEFIKIATKREINVLCGWCLSDAGVPYFPFIEAFSSLHSNIEELFSPVTSQMVSQVDRLGTNQSSRLERSPQIWMESTFASVTQQLLEISSKKPVLLVLEDIHWADSASLALLHYISRFISSERILVLATFRSEGLSFDLERQPSTLVATLRTMNREDLYSEIKLPNLSQLEVGMLAESMLGGVLQSSFIEKLSAESQGNPLFVVESLRTLMSEGSLIQDNGLWCPSTEKLTIPLKVKDVILQRISGLKLKHRKILDVASVLGDKFDYKLIASVIRQEPIQVLEKLNLIACNTSLIKYEDNLYSFDHAKSRQIIYDELPAPLRTGYHTMIAERLEALSKNQKKSVAIDLAFHYEKAGNAHKTLVYALLAGKEALARFSNLEAKKLFSRVLEIAEGKEEYSNDCIAAVEGVGDASFAAGEFQEAQKTFLQLLNGPTVDVVKLRALRKAMASARWVGDFGRSIELSKEADILREVNRLEYARVILNKGAALGSFGNTKDALKYLEKALIVFEEENSLADLAQALNEIASIYQTEGYPEKAVATAKRAIALNEEIGDFRGLVDAYFYAGQIFFNYRLQTEALKCFGKSMEIGERIGYEYRTGWAAIYSAITLDIMGDLKSAIAQNLLAAKYAQRTDSHYLQSQSCANLLALYSKLGDLKNAEECYLEIKRQYPDESKAGSKLGYAAIIKAEALFFAAKKEWEKSNRLFNLSLNLLKGALFSKSFESTMRQDYAATLESQGRHTDAFAERAKASTLTKKADNQFREFFIETALTVKRENFVGEQFAVRLDVVNVSKMNGFLEAIDNLDSQIFSICKIPDQYKIAKGTLDLKKHFIEPFQLLTINFTLIANKEGIHSFSPGISYTDEIGNSKKCKLDPVNIKIGIERQSNVNLSEKGISAIPIDAPSESFQESPVEFHFKNDASNKVFDFLVSSFVEDYMRLRLPMEKSGWRTLMDAVKRSKVPVSAVYGRRGRLGKVIGELQRRGLIETRFFQGERGRGGNIMKFRICYEREPVKRQIDLRVAKDKK